MNLRNLARTWPRTTRAQQWDDALSTARFEFRWRDPFCSMKITQDVRDYAAKLEEAEAGMAAKTAEFREKGCGVYLPVADVDEERQEAIAAD